VLEEDIANPGRKDALAQFVALIAHHNRAHFVGVARPASVALGLREHCYHVVFVRRRGTPVMESKAGEFSEHF
jgi:hypothetical protein